MSDVSVYASEKGKVDSASSAWTFKGPAGGDGATQMAIIGFKSKSAQVTSLSSGWVETKRKNSTTVGGACVLLTSSLGTGTSEAQDLTIQFDTPTLGTWSSVSIDGDIEGVIAETDDPFSLVHTLAAKTATRDGSCVFAFKSTGEHPKLSSPRAPLGTLNIAEETGLNGPSTVINAAPADDGDTITPIFDSTDAFGNPANDGDAYMGFTVLMAPRDQNTISGGGVIPIRGIKAITVTSAPQSIDQGSSGTFVINVVGTDDLPFEGVVVSATPNGGGNMANSQIATDASGNASFVFNATQAGNRSITFAADDKEAFSTFMVNQVASTAADSVTLTASFATLKAGQSVTLVVQANAGAQAATGRSGTLTYTLPGGAQIAEPFTTNSQGQYNRLLTPQQVGTLVADAVVDGVNATTLNITVEEAPPVTASPSSVTVPFPGDPATVLIRRGTALAPGLQVQSANTTVATVSSLTSSASEITVTPVGIGATVISVTYIDSSSGGQTTLDIPVTVTAAEASQEVNDIVISGGLPNITVGQAPVEIEFTNQDGVAIVDDNMGRLEIVQFKPHRVAISHAGDDGKFWVYGTGAGETSLQASYVRSDGKIVRQTFAFTVLSP